MSEFAAVFKSFRFHWSHLSGISVSVLSASIHTHASAFKNNLGILYLPCPSLYSVWLRCLQHALPLSTNVNTILNLQYVFLASIVSTLSPYFPWTVAPIQFFFVVWMLFWSVGGSRHHSISPIFPFPSFNPRSFRSSLLWYVYLCYSVPVQCPPRINIIGNLAPRTPSFVVLRFARILFKPLSCLNITKCVELSHLIRHHSSARC